MGVKLHMQYALCAEDKEYTLPGCQTLFKTVLFVFILVFFTPEEKCYTYIVVGDKYRVCPNVYYCGYITAMGL